MFDLGFSELLLFGIIALIVLGPEKMPHAVRKAGRAYAKFRRHIATIQREIENELDLAETRQQMQDELAKIRKAEADMKREMDQLKSSFQALQQHSIHEKPNTNDTKPMLNQWFILSDYDKNRRWPNAPLLPNYQADRLLNHLPSTTNKL
ncbi:twin-arginine translocation protein subunit TatB [Moraxella macacae 0408225]|uniref:Sec-independent protein translocase protein TatB n=1 Tax=Moraxella macacae 0408225 TaxID=1230338 RepID=L2F908_9GAMM|nr:Sec-independent protein translocase protein TatB [Moraxella macacae]ELA08958.1 twin-arginine translocation protein subunit TatB [Moraxella macacae 0408225]